MWKSQSVKGRWNIHWKAEATLYSKALLQFGRHTLTNFSESMVLNTTVLPANGQATIFVDLASPDRECTVSGLYEISRQRVLSIYVAPTQGFATFGSVFAWNAANIGRIESSFSINMSPAEFIQTVAVGQYVLLFDMTSLHYDRIPIIDTTTVNYESSARGSVSLTPDMRMVKSSTRAPVNPRVGASIVHYDGYVIFFGGIVNTRNEKSTNEISVLSVGPHRSVEAVLDSLEIADAALDDSELGLDLDIEIAPKKKKKKKKAPSKAVKFEDEEDSDSSSAEERKKQKEVEEDIDEDLKAAIAASLAESKDTNAKDEKEEEGVVQLPETNSDSSIPPAPLFPAKLKPNMQIPRPEPIKDTSAPAPPAPTVHRPAEPPAPSAELDPAGALEHWLTKNQTHITKLLDFAANNPDCYPDMAFKVDGKIYWAHKAIICARSSRWRQTLEGQAKSKTSSPSTGRRGDLEDSQLDVSTESAMPPIGRQGSTVVSPFMFSRLGSGAIDLMLEEDDSKSSKHEMVTLPPRFSTLTSRPEFSPIPPAPSHIPPPPGSKDTKNAAEKSIVITNPSPSSSSDSVVSSASSSGIAPPAKSVPIYTLEDINGDAFMKVLRFMYSGQISVSPSESEAIADVAHEFLLDEVSALCRERSERNYSEPSLKLSRMLRRLVGSSVGSDYFFVVRRKKLFAHRFLILLFSSHFRARMQARAEKSYVEITELDDLDVSVETFIDFCRMMYSNFSSLPEHAEKKMDVHAMTKLCAEWGEYRCLALLSSVKPDAASTLELFRLASKNKALLRDVRRRILLNFGRFVQDKKVIQSLDRSEQITWRHLGELAGASYLDRMWFALAIGDQKQLADVESQLGVLINVENVLPVLFGAHQAGLKKLRSLCMDFMSAHSTSIEDARRMQVDAPLALGKVAGLSASLNNELTSKLSSATASASGSNQKVKRCAHCSKSFPTFGKKTNCALCHKITCSDCTKKKTAIPPIFGFSKPRDICVSCSQVVDIWTDPATKKTN